MALVHRLSRACSTCVASAITAGTCLSMRTCRSIDGGNVTLSRRVVSCTTSGRWMGLRVGVSLRLNVRIWRTRSRARRPAFSISSRLVMAGDWLPASCLASSTLPRMAPRMLLKSCAMPPAMVPTACIFCDSRNCDSSTLRWVSIFLRAVRSRAKTVMMSPSSRCSNETLTSTANGLPPLVRPSISPSCAWVDSWL